MITEGISLFLTGQRNNDGGLVLQSVVDISSLENLETIGTPDNFIQAPTIQKKNERSRTTVSAGSSVVAALIESTYTDRSRQGIGHHSNMLFGGARSDETAKRLTVVLVTPFFKAG